MNLTIRKKRVFIYLATLLAGILIGAGVFLLAVSFYHPARQTVQEPSTVQQALYCVRETDGKICVYHGNEQTPQQTLDIDPALLPEQDREMLKNGIYLNSEAELRRLLEDYDS